MFKGKADLGAARRFLDARGGHPGQLREFCGVSVSALAVGTYLGNMDEVTDAKVTASCVRAVELGCNFFDTAINYRGQRAERSVGEAIRRLVLSGKARREELFVSTKGGFVPFEREPVSDMARLFEEQYVSRGIARAADLVGGCHCMEPDYLSEQIERSRRNLQLETIDLYYLHNPEMQLEELPERIFYAKLEKAFARLEEEARAGRIGAYGMATWNAFREEASSQSSVQLEKCVAAAARAAGHTSSTLGARGGGQSHFRAIQLPLNLAMPEAALLKTQRVADSMLSAIDAADALGLDVAVSVPLLQSRLCHDLPEFIVEKFPKSLSQAHCALSFATAFPAVSAAMVGMKAPEHVEHDLAFLRRPPLTESELKGVVNSMIEQETS